VLLKRRRVRDGGAPLPHRSSRRPRNRRRWAVLGVRAEHQPVRGCQGTTGASGRTSPPTSGAIPSSSTKSEDHQRYTLCRRPRASGRPGGQWHPGRLFRPGRQAHTELHPSHALQFIARRFPTRPSRHPRVRDRPSASAACWWPNRGPRSTLAGRGEADGDRLPHYRSRTASRRCRTGAILEMAPQGLARLGLRPPFHLARGAGRLSADLAAATTAALNALRRTAALPDWRWLRRRFRPVCSGPGANASPDPDLRPNEQTSRPGPRHLPPGASPARAPVPERVRQAIAEPVVNHRGPEFHATLGAGA